jgi:hypothetical protein
MKTATHPTGRILTFDSKKHEYLLGGTKLTSVTTIIKDNFPQFDSEKVAIKSAAKAKMTVDAILQLWKKSGDEASAFGNLIHLMAETIILNYDLGAADYLAKTEREEKFLAALKVSISQIIKNYHILEVEKIVFSPVKKVAGTIDLLLQHKTTGSIIVGDWKTSKEIKRSAYNNELGLGLCSHLQNCNYVHYSLQLAVYKELLISEGYLEKNARVSGAIIHLKDEGPIVTVDQIEPLKLFNEAIQIIKPK